MTRGIIVRGPAPSPAMVPSITVKIAGMQLALHVEEIDEHLVHVLVRVVPHLAEQAAERVLDRAGHHGVPVRLDRREMDDLSARIDRRDLDALGEDVVQLEQRTLEAVDLPLDFGQRRERQPCRSSTDSQRLFRQPARGSVTTVLFSIGISRCGRSRRRASCRSTPSTCHGCDEHDGKYLVHDRFSLSSVSRSARDRVAVAGEVHDARVILEHGLGTRAHDGDARRAGGRRRGDQAPGLQS